MKKRILVILTAVLLLIGALAMSAFAAEGAEHIYVAASGDDANAGTESAPVASFNKALELVKDGGTIHIVDT